MTDTDAMLVERGQRYGDFTGHAQITQDLKQVMAETANWKWMKSDMKEALEMIAHKIGRILNGDPGYADSWSDIAGYARLVEQRLELVNRPPQSPEAHAVAHEIARKTGLPEWAVPMMGDARVPTQLDLDV